MPESNATNAQRQLEMSSMSSSSAHPVQGNKAQADKRLATGHTAQATPTSRLYILSTAEKDASSPQHVQNIHDQEEPPPWLRPFLSLRIQLTIGYGLLLLFVILMLLAAFSQHFSMFLLEVFVFALLVLGTLLAFGLTSLLLRPLLRTTDAAQAIALGDLKQRDRLPLRMPPQDEIDRLAGSLDAMAVRLEHAEEAQNQSEQRFSRFFSDASHQLRTPLTSIRGFTEILLRGVNRDDPEATQHALYRMKSEAERMTRLINDLLTLARLDDTRLLKTQYTDLVELAEERIAQVKTQANDGRAITLVVNADAGLGVQADRERLKQLLFILLDNALKYGRPAPDGIITLQLEQRNGHAIIRVIDNGEGISEEDLHHIFDAFYRGHHRQAVISSTGSGLGLAIAERIVRVHNGTIAATSTVQEGTVFTVTLPSVC